jgi:hypothetical protein
MLTGPSLHTTGRLARRRLHLAFAQEPPPCSFTFRPAPFYPKRFLPLAIVQPQATKTERLMLSRGQAEIRAAAENRRSWCTDEVLARQPLDRRPSQEKVVAGIAHDRSNLSYSVNPE